MRPRTFFWPLVLFSLSSISFLLYPAEPLTTVTRAISQFCTDMMQLLPVAAMLMILIGAVVYAAGQVMGAETRARANVWATAALTGALMSMLIVAIAPVALELIYGEGNVNCTGENMCGPAVLQTGETCCFESNVYWTCPLSYSCESGNIGGCI
jgi:uncharacterized membrane protein